MPSTSSMAKNGVPAASPTLNTGTMPGCRSRPAASASRRNRETSRPSSLRVGGSTFSATRRLRLVCSAS